MLYSESNTILYSNYTSRKNKKEKRIYSSPDKYNTGIMITIYNRYINDGSEQEIQK